MRKFKLVNAHGSVFDLMRKDAYFHNVGGLGSSRSFGLQDAGGAWIETDDETAQPDPYGTMAFAGYKQYTEFVQFCAIEPLALQYCPYGSTWHSIDCKLESIKKTEISKGYLSCAVTFSARSMWYRTIYKYTGATQSTGKKYPFQYPYQYAGSPAGTVQLKLDTLQNSPCKIHIFGPCVNPHWALYKDSQMVTEGRVAASIPSGNKLVVDSNPESLSIAEYTNAGTFVKNLYQSADFSTGRFVLVPPGESFITISHDGTEQLNNPAVEVKIVDATV